MEVGGDGLMMLGSTLILLGSILILWVWLIAADF